MSPAIRELARAPLPTRWGVAELLVFEVAGAEVRVLRFGDPRGEVNVRLHAACATSEVFGSLKCDCREQLEASLAWLSATEGLLLYTPQEEGRGIGFVEKVKSYALQARGLDTVDANLALGHPVDARDHRRAGWLLCYLGVERVALATNNPDKQRAIESCGIDVRRVSLPVSIAPEAEQYLLTKVERCGHLVGERS